MGAGTDNNTSSHTQEDNEFWDPDPKQLERLEQLQQQVEQRIECMGDRLERQNQQWHQPLPSTTDEATDEVEEE